MSIEIGPNLSFILEGLVVLAMITVTFYFLTK